MIELLLQMGIRLGELVGLTLADIQLPPKIHRSKSPAGAIKVRGKGRKERTITLNWKACQPLASYLAVRPAIDHTAVFVSRFGLPMGARAIQDVVEKHLRQAAIPDASVHGLRHTFATHMVRKGTNLRVVQEALGHASLNTTSRYVSLARDLMDQQLQANAL